MIRYLRPARPRRPAATRGGYRLLASLRPEQPPEPCDPCGGGPLEQEAARRRAITTLITAMTRYTR